MPARKSLLEIWNREDYKKFREPGDKHINTNKSWYMDDTLSLSANQHSEVVLQNDTLCPKLLNTSRWS